MPEPITQNLVNLLRDLVRNAATRNEEKRFVVEGPHLLEEAIKHKAGIVLIAATQAFFEANAPLILRAKNAKLFQLSAKQAERVSDTEAPQGVFTLIDMPKDGQVGQSGIVLMLDEVQDPGNVGTLIRTASWFGITEIVLGKGTADAYNPKVIRGSQGALFSTKVVRLNDLVKEAQLLKKKGYTIVSTTLASKSQSAFEFAPVRPMVIVLGSEARGVRKEIVEVSDTTLHIPRKGSGESLNVAVSGGIVMALITQSS